jgi:hypothetical protein
MIKITFEVETVEEAKRALDIIEHYDLAKKRLPIKRQKVKR